MLVMMGIYSGSPASPTHSYRKLSLVVMTAPSLRSRASAMGTSSLLQLLTPSAMMYTLCPRSSKSSAVCVTLECINLDVDRWSGVEETYADVRFDTDDYASEGRFEGVEAFKDFRRAVKGVPLASNEMKLK